MLDIAHCFAMCDVRPCFFYRREQGQILDALRKCHIRSRHRMLISIRPQCRRFFGELGEKRDRPLDWTDRMSMRSDSRNQDIFELAFAGIPRVAELIAALRLEDRIRALDAAEQRYKQMARDLGVSEGAADVWAAAVMSLIRLRVVEETVQRVPMAPPGWTMSYSSTTNGPSSDANSVAHTAARNMESAAA